MSAPRRPLLIGVTGPDRGGQLPWLLVRLALTWGGARAVRLTPRHPRRDLALDALVITGGHDIDPVLYATAPQVRPRYDAARDALESAAIDDALRQDLPLLGICRGAQLLNVRLGGSLFQELRSRRRHTGNRWTILPLKTLLVTAGSRLSALLGAPRVRINSLHNQAIDRLGAGLVVGGRDLDEIVQAIEAPDRAFVLGVQWHPEFLLYRADQRRLFTALIAAARAHSDPEQPSHVADPKR